MGGRDYLSSITSVDVQAAFLREKPRIDHIAKLRGVSTKRAPGLPQALPAKEMVNILNDPTAIKLYRDLCQLREHGATENNVNKTQRKVQNLSSWAQNSSTGVRKEEWLEDCYAKIIRTEGRISHDRSSAIDRVQALFRVLPERARLADMIKSDEPRTRAQRLLAVQDLFSLSTRNFEVMYRPDEEPVDGACPVCRCKLPQVKRNRAGHIYACRRKEFAARIVDWQSAGSASAPVQYCFLCFKWFDGGDAWKEHCRGHLNSTTPKWVYCHTLISPGFCPGNNGPASERLRQWTRNCTLMAHVEDHVEKVYSWPTTCPCGRRELPLASPERRIWPLGSRMEDVRQEQGSEDDEEPIDPAPTLSLEDAGQTRPRKDEKRAKTRSKFIEWSPSRKEQSPNPPTSRTRASNRRKMSQKLVSTGTTFIERSPAAEAGSSNLASSQYGGLATRESAISAPSSPKHYPELDWDSPSVTVVDNEEPPDGQALLERPPRIHNRSDSFLPGDSTDGEFWLDDVSWTENSITNPTSVSTPVTDIGPDTFKDILDPALFCLEGSISQPLTSEHSHDINTPRSDEEDELDLPSLESLLRCTPVPPSSKPDRELGHGEPTESTIQIQGWKETVGRESASQVTLRSLVLHPE